MKCLLTCFHEIKDNTVQNIFTEHIVNITRLCKKKYEMLGFCVGILTKNNTMSRTFQKYVRKSIQWSMPIKLFYAIN